MSASDATAELERFLRYRAGEQLAALAAEAGVSRQSLQRRWARRKWEPRSTRHVLTTAEVRSVLAAASDGLTIPEIMRRTGLPRRIVSAVLSREKVRVPVAKLALRRQAHWRQLIVRLLDGETWRDILGPGVVFQHRQNEIAGLMRYCRAVGIPLPAEALATLREGGRRTITPAATIADAVAACIAELSSGPRPLVTLSGRAPCATETLARHLLAAGCRIERPGRGVARIVHGPGGER